MMHATVLGALIDIRAIYKAARIEMPEALQHAIDRMAPALRFFRHGDGGLALFNGSQEGEALLLDTILTQADARGRPLKRAPQAGFDRLTLGRTIIIVDSGGPPPARLDRQAHAGIGSFEMSVGRERFIVNCGAHPGASPWRTARGSRPANRFARHNSAASPTTSTSVTLHSRRWPNDDIAHQSRIVLLR